MKNKKIKKNKNFKYINKIIIIILIYIKKIKINNI